MKFALHQLEKFVAAGQEGHGGRAAARFGVAESVFNRSINALEDALHLQLFDRKGKRRRFNTLTPFGKTLLADAAPLVKRAEELLRKLSASAKGQAEEQGLRIALAPGTTLPRMARLFCESRKQERDLVLSVVQQNYAPLVRELREGFIDVGFASWLVNLRNPNPISNRLKDKKFKDKDDDLTLTPIWDDPFVVAMQPDSPLASKPAIDMLDFTPDLPRPLLLSDSSVVNNNSMAWLAAMMRGETVSGFELMLTHAAAGYGIALVNGAFIEGLERQDLVFRPLHDDCVSRTFALTRKGVDIPLLTRFLERARRMTATHTR